MKHNSSATVWQECPWLVAQCLEVDIASQGETEEEALTNLREALALHLEPPRATIVPKVRTVQFVEYPQIGSYGRVVPAPYESSKASARCSVSSWGAMCTWVPMGTGRG